MFENILIGIDGRQGGRDALALAKRLAPDASFVLAHVVGRGPNPWWTQVVWEERGFEPQSSMLAAHREAAGVDAAMVCVQAATPARGLHELAERHGTDLIVVGCSRHALLGRVLLGDDARASLDGTPCAVAVAPRGYAATPHRLLEIGVGYDGSPESERALSTARDIAEGNGQVKVLSVVSLQNVKDEAPIPADWPEASERLVAAAAQRLSGLGGVESEAAYGGPREELARFSSEVDLLVIGSRAYGPFGRLRRGSVSRYLVGHVACPLLILPRAAAVAAVAVG